MFTLLFMVLMVVVVVKMIGGLLHIAFPILIFVGIISLLTSGERV